MSFYFGKKLKDIRTDMNMTINELATVLQTTKSTISKWENNKLEPNLDMLVALANFLDVSTDYLLGLEDDFGNKIKTEDTQKQTAAPKFIGVAADTGDIKNKFTEDELKTLASELQKLLDKKD